MGIDKVFTILFVQALSFFMFAGFHCLQHQQMCWPHSWVGWLVAAVGSILFNLFCWGLAPYDNDSAYESGTTWM